MKIKHLFIFAISLLLVACNRTKTPDPEPGETLSSEQMRDFFPSDIGTTWTYLIQIYGDDFPLQYNETEWSVRNQLLSYSTRGLIRPPRKADGDNSQSKKFSLQYKVKAASVTQGMLKFPDGVELEILKDELGIFKNNKQVYWAIRDSGDFFVNLVITYPPDSPGSPVSNGYQSLNAGEGTMIRLIYFGNKPGLEMGLSGSPDALYFIGPEKEVKGYEGIVCLHFQRNVKGEVKKKDEDKSRNPDWLSQSFSEDTWFVKGKGLVLLEQHIGEQLSMRWSLTSDASVGSSAKDESSWKVKSFNELSDNEIEASMNISKKVFDEILGKNLITYYQTENHIMLKESGYWLGGVENMDKLIKPVVGLSAAYRSNSVNQSLIDKLEKAAKNTEIDRKGVKMSIIKCIVEVIPEGAGEYYDKVTIFPLRVKVIQSK